MTPSARISAAIELIAAIDAAPRKPADAIANQFFRDRRFIGSGDRRAVSDRVWTILRTRRRLGWWLERVAMRVNPRMLAAASLITSGWAVSGVKQAFSGGQFGPTPLNPGEQAALAGIEGQEISHPDMALAVRLEVPDWCVPHLETRFGARIEAEMAAMDLPATLDLRVNLLSGSREQALAALAAEGIVARPTPISPWGLRIDGRRPVSTGPAFQSGLVEIQDEGSQIVAALVGAAPEMRVVDWCAGAGGKTLALAMTMQNRGHIVACDVSEHRLEGAVRRLRRAGVHNVERHLVTAGDKWAKRRAGTFDRVLVDAPCTGTGTWRRNPDARQRLTANDLAELVVKQAHILDDAARLVKPGGRLIYATCSILLEENDQQMAGFLARHPGFRIIPLSRAWNFDCDVPGEGAYLSLTPLAHHTDGFFTAVLERTA
jgi:16S rRNA (cytosine967-C5)-methyltransferase